MTIDKSDEGRRVTGTPSDLICQAEERLAAAKTTLACQHEAHAEAQAMDEPIGHGDLFEDGTRKAGESLRIRLAQRDAMVLMREACAALAVVLAGDPTAEVPVEGGAALVWFAARLRGKL